MVDKIVLGAALTIVVCFTVVLVALTVAALVSLIGLS